MEIKQLSSDKQMFNLNSAFRTPVYDCSTFFEEDQKLKKS